VSEVALVGVPDPEWTERAVACVVTRPGAVVSLEELRDLVRNELGSIYAPRELHLFSELPRTSIGKLRRSELVADVRARSAP
jgi:acyl-coenzyme A synthetase/AMP-(fatty) acid ligase